MRGTVSERIYREVKVMMIGGGAEEIMKDLAARQLGLWKYALLGRAGPWRAGWADARGASANGVGLTGGLRVDGAAGRVGAGVQVFSFSLTSPWATTLPVRSASASSACTSVRLLPAWAIGAA
ncbi:MAG: acyl-CoA dehydrogenase family protein [Acidovorax sp.]|nr:acyl-CoA dehydrogenase family protein [Acidovorax sp.]MDZ7866182.1 acyl-CoA dehydrogenase family protein [Acidovorax sp.]